MKCNNFFKAAMIRLCYWPTTLLSASAEAAKWVSKELYEVFNCFINPECLQPSAEHSRVPAVHYEPSLKRVCAFGKAFHIARLCLWTLFMSISPQHISIPRLTYSQEPWTPRRTGKTHSYPMFHSQQKSYKQLMPPWTETVKAAFEDRKP